MIYPPTCGKPIHNPKVEGEVEAGRDIPKKDNKNDGDVSSMDNQLKDDDVEKLMEILRYVTFCSHFLPTPMFWSSCGSFVLSFVRCVSTRKLVMGKSVSWSSVVCLHAGTHGCGISFESFAGSGLSWSRDSIADAMVFCISRATCAGDIVSIIAESLTLAETAINLKIARLFLVSDILHNSSVAQVKNCWVFRSNFQGTK